MNNVYLVLEVYWLGNWNPWAIIFDNNEAALVYIFFMAELMLKPLGYRFSDTNYWYGLENTIKRMNKIYNPHLN